MLTEQFYQILDHYTTWRLGIDLGNADKTGRPSKEKIPKEKEKPRNTYPIVESFNTIESPCDWCDKTCSKTKYYTKANTTKTVKWRGKCNDCGETRVVSTEEMIKTPRFTIAKDL